jgi:hypothetical protein
MALPPRPAQASTLLAQLSKLSAGLTTPTAPAILSYCSASWMHAPSLQTPLSHKLGIYGSLAPTLSLLRVQTPTLLTAPTLPSAKSNLLWPLDGVDGTGTLAIPQNGGDTIYKLGATFFTSLCNNTSLLVKLFPSTVLNWMWGTLSQPPSTND